jgi:hypothetical protein
MALIVGSVEVDEEGGYTGTGLTKRLVDAVLATPNMAAVLAQEGLSIEQKVSVVQGMADYSEAMATAIIDEIQANAEVTVTVSASDAGLQRIPASTAEDTPCKAPAAPVELSTKGTVA